MLARNEVIFKWALYTAATLLCLLLQGLLQRATVWGVIPFLYPVIAAVPATFENPTAATTYALVIGVVCDLLLPGPLPCFYTVIFPLVGLCAALLAQSALPAGFACSLVSTAIAFLLTDLFACLLLWFGGKGAWSAGMGVMLREFLVTVPLTLPMTMLFRAVHRRTHMDD